MKNTYSADQKALIQNIAVRAMEKNAHAASSAGGILDIIDGIVVPKSILTVIEEAVDQCFIKASKIAEHKAYLAEHDHDGDSNEQAIAVDGAIMNIREALDAMVISPPSWIPCTGCGGTGRIKDANHEVFGMKYRGKLDFEEALRKVPNVKCNRCNGEGGHDR